MTVETLTEPEALDWLRAAAAEVPADQAVVEVGVFRGGSLKHLCDGAKEGHGAVVYGVDAWGSDGVYPDRPHMRERYKRTDKAVARRTCPTATLIHALSSDAAAAYDGPPIGLLYIDCVHTEAAVLADFEAWAPHLADGALVAFDDYCDRFPGVAKAVEHLMTVGRLENVGGLIGSRLAVTRKPGGDHA